MILLILLLMNPSLSNTMTFRIKVFSFDSLVDFTLPLEAARQVISEFSGFECIEQIWVLNAGVWQEQISHAD